MNTFFKHKLIHKYTREVISRGEWSIIDYVIINNNYKKEVLDTRVRRGAELYTDHYLVFAKIKIKTERQEIKNSTGKIKRRKETLKTYKLRQREIADIYTRKIEKEMEKLKEIIQRHTVENLWIHFKEAILKTANEVCGKMTIDESKKQTRWRNEEIKTGVKVKKKKWRNYLRNRNNENYMLYKEQRTKVKEIVKREKQKTWKKFGEKLEQDKQGNDELFYKALKTLRKK